MKSISVIIALVCALGTCSAQQWLEYPLSAQHAARLTLKLDTLSDGGDHAIIAYVDSMTAIERVLVVIDSTVVGSDTIRIYLDDLSTTLLAAGVAEMPAGTVLGDEPAEIAPLMQHGAWHVPTAKRTMRIGYAPATTGKLTVILITREIY